MDFGFNEDQDQLRRAVREYFAAEMPVSFSRAMLEDERGFPAQAWESLSVLGWLGLTVSEEAGGSGLGLLDLVLVMEEAGAVTLPGPFPSTVSLAVPLLQSVADNATGTQLLAAVAVGSRRVACAIAEKRGRWEASAITATARRETAGWVLDGTKYFVPDAGLADTLIVAAQAGDGLGFFAVAVDAPGVRIEAMKTVDRTRRLFVVTLEAVKLEASAMLGGRVFPGVVLDGVIDRAKVALAAEMVGAADRTLAMTVEYTGLREQFGRSLAAFQVIQHRAADMKVAVEHARSLVYYAAWACDTGASDSRLAAAMAKAFASDACPRVAADAVQLHGGIGFTWEHDLHLYFKRLKADEQTYGDAIANRELVARILEEMP